MNELGAKYLVVGGLAVIRAGYPRFTGDIDLVIAPGRENEARVYEALEIFADKAVRELDPGDVERYTVVRVVDEVLVDLMQSACGIGYAEAAPYIEVSHVDGVPIPFASPLLLWRMKKPANREKDIPDLLFLQRLLSSQGITPPE
ncbi:MAG TPA: hypothetical protein VF614_14915 [Chthoniobacteraceae bacterium]